MSSSHSNPPAETDPRHATTTEPGTDSTASTAARHAAQSAAADTPGAAADTSTGTPTGIGARADKTRLGATPTDQGTTFAVWAPGVDAIAVIGDFNDWDSDGYPLAQTDGDIWTGHLPQCKHGDEYVYELTANGQTFTRLDPQGAVVNPATSSSVIHDHDTYAWEHPDFETPPRSELVTYRAPLAHWYRADTLDTALLAHLQSLGFTAVSVACSRDEIPGPGYHPGSIYASDLSFGGPHAFKHFVDCAHQHGMAVLLDVDYSHLGPFDIDVWEFCGPVDDEFGGPYFYSGPRAMTPWGDTRPDYSNAMVRQFLVDNAMMWLRDYHLDGLTLAHVPYMVHEHGAAPSADDFAAGRLDDGWQLLQEISAAVRAEFPNAVLTADTWHHQPSLTDNSGDGAALHVQTDAEFTERVLGAVWTDFPADGDPLGQLADGLARCDHGEPLRRAVGVGASLDSSIAWQAPENAQESKTVSSRRNLMAETITCLAPGHVVVRANRVLPTALDGGKSAFDQWPTGPEVDQHHAFLRDLLALRSPTGLAALPVAQVMPFHINNDGGVLVCQMWRDHGVNDDLVIVANFSEVDYPSYLAGLPAAGRWEQAFTSARAAYGYGTSDCAEPGDVYSRGEAMHSLDESAEFVVPAQSVTVYVWRGEA